MGGLRLAVVVTAAGRSQRFGGGKKEFADAGGRSVLDRALSPFIGLEGLEVLVVTAPEDSLDRARERLSPTTLATLGDRLIVTAGGISRRDSVRLGLEKVAAFLSAGRDAPSEATAEALDSVIVLVHDGARPWASAGLALRVAEAASRHGAALPLLPLTDTPKEKGPLGEDATGTVLGHPPRSGLGGAQTPQGFRLGSLLAAHRRAASEGLECTDDTELWATYEGPVAWVEGEAGNRKVTYGHDLPPSQAADLPFRIGQGWDLHRLSPERRLFLGGLEIEAPAGELAHSDGDVLLHAVIDALLGGAALGDIGTHFPPSDPKWKDADSKDLAATAVALVREAGFEPVNLDCTVIVEQPRLGPHKEAIRTSIAAVLDMAPERVSVKAKTSEGVDAVGEGKAIEAEAVVLLALRPLPSRT
jgi:2-C-methyl-D-erythritol 4-phosphate cytidylyltransferase/2-C-methyl-D-erythritol 2,4-cyclodiphosphate synthase